ncbi:MAG: flagellar basal body P-ring formation protein FlgA [Alphaproteobacteria bacterium]|nr:flagellar basal body P-ring formation protein FlgA [Alphaproteobacteria bacterium]
MNPGIIKQYFRHLSALVAFIVIELPLLAFLLAVLGLVAPAHSAEDTLPALPAAEDAAVETVQPVMLKPASEIDREEIMLGDVFANLPEGIDRPLARAPLPGKKVVYDVTILSRLSAAYRLGWRPQTLTEQAVLSRAANTVSNEMILAAVHDALADQGLEGDIEVQLDNRSLAFDLPTSVAPDFTVSNMNYDPASNRFNADGAVAPGSSYLQHVTLTGRAVTRVAVPVLARALGAGEVIGKDDIAWIKVPGDRSTDYVRTAADLIGKEMRRGMADNLPLRARDVTPERMVRRGALVTMKVKTAMMLLTTQGRAMEDGAQGDVIRVVNTQSKRVVEATVEAPGLVSVASAAATARKVLAAATTEIE